MKWNRNFPLNKFQLVWQSEKWNDRSLWYYGALAALANRLQCIEVLQNQPYITHAQYHTDNVLFVCMFFPLPAAIELWLWWSKRFCFLRALFFIHCPDCGSFWHRMCFLHQRQYSSFKFPGWWFSSLADCIG